MDLNLRRTLPKKHSGVHVLNVPKMRNVSSFEDMQWKNYIKHPLTNRNPLLRKWKRQNQNVVKNSHCNTVYLSDLFFLKLFRKELPCRKWEILGTRRKQFKLKNGKEGNTELGITRNMNFW